jgi:peptidoglycan/xylan/chitin deacetylase (PgdA/CDA1 family)
MLGGRSLAIAMSALAGLCVCLQAVHGADAKMADAADVRIPATPAASPISASGLAGRTIRVGSASDISLRPGEVLLTFDDGPLPGPTEAVLSALRAYGVRATFLMVGRMARKYPITARKVAAAGMTIGTHTERHAKLSRIGTGRALAEIDTGRRSVAAALGPSGHRLAPFFRFPYLADTAALRRQLAAQRIVVLDVDVDATDYRRSSPGRVKARTMRRLKSRGSGIILFHDIHARTAKALPLILDELAANGFKVVHLVPAQGAPDNVVAATITTDIRAFGYSTQKR